MSQTVLVADDSRTIRKVVEMALKATRYDVVGVESAREAMEAAQQRPAVILLDYYMPDGSGYDICRALKGNAATSGIPVIMLGGTYKSFDPNLAQNCGADKVVMKPFKTDDLINAIEAVVGAGASSVAPTPAPVANNWGAPAPPAPPAPAPVANNWGTPAPPAPPAPMPAGPSAFQSTPPKPPAAAAEAVWGATPPPFGGPPSPESQPRISTSSTSQPRIAPPDVNASSRQPSPTPAPLPASTPAPVASGSHSGMTNLGMSRSELEDFIREEVRKTIRDEVPNMLRNVMGEVFQQKVLPKLVKHSEEKIQETLRQELDTRIAQQVRSELERLLSEE
jgi:CheY-like chemotaxis protein